MWRRSISRGSTQPTAHARAVSRMRSASPSRCRSVRRFESSIPAGSKPSPRITAPATTGPQSAPRPTSSHPATRWRPWERASSSNAHEQRNSCPRWTRGRRPRAGRTGFGAMARAAGGSGLRHRRRALLLHAPGLPLALAHVVELGPADLGLLHHLHLLDRPGVQGADPLHAVAEGVLAHGHGGPGARALEPDAQALEDMHALALGL